MKPPVILIGGPTASGKSSLALELASACQAAIINADALQIYEGLPILSAQPGAAAQATVPHELYGVLPASATSSAAGWLAQAKDVIRHTHRENRTPILVGGTGFYFRALLEGLAEIPVIPAEVRQETAALFDRVTEAEFRARLRALDPQSAARIARNDRQRLMRAYEVVIATKVSLSQWHAKQPGPAQDFLFEIHLIAPAREKLYATADERFLKMVDEGALPEVRALVALKLEPQLPIMKTLGFRELASFIEGTLSLDDAVKAGQQATRNYAKRQLTWFRNQWKSLDLIHH